MRARIYIIPILSIGVFVSPAGARLATWVEATAYENASKMAQPEERKVRAAYMEMTSRRQAADEAIAQSNAMAAEQGQLDAAIRHAKQEVAHKESWLKQAWDPAYSLREFDRRLKAKMDAIKLLNRLRAERAKLNAALIKKRKTVGPLRIRFLDAHRSYATACVRYRERFVGLYSLEKDRLQAIKKQAEDKNFKTPHPVPQWLDSLLSSPVPHLIWGLFSGDLCSTDSP